MDSFNKVKGEIVDPIANNNNTLRISNYQEILKKNGIANKISEISVTALESHLEGCSSEIELLEIRFEKQLRSSSSLISSLPSLHLVVKKRLPLELSKGREEMMQQLIRNEGQFLKEFVTEMQEFCLEEAERAVGQNKRVTALLDGLFPLVYHKDDDKIVMDNLMFRDFSVFPRDDAVDFRHARLVVENLAKLHGVTYAMIEREDGTDQFLEKHAYMDEPLNHPEFRPFLSSILEPLFSALLQVLQSSSCEEAAKTFRMLKEYEGKFVHTMAECCESPTLFSVVCHGDFSKNNILFKDPTKVAFIDLQIPRVGSPNLDLAYFLFTSVQSEARRRWKELLSIYFSRLQQIVQSLNQTFPFAFEEFVEDFARKSKMGLFSGLIFNVMVSTEGKLAAKDAQEGDLRHYFQTWLLENPERVNQMIQTSVSNVQDYLLFGEL